jgi:hypothetical protein
MNRREPSRMRLWRGTTWADLLSRPAQPALARAAVLWHWRWTGGDLSPQRHPLQHVQTVPTLAGTGRTAGGSADRSRTRSTTTRSQQQRRVVPWRDRPGRHGRGSTIPTGAPVAGTPSSSCATGAARPGAAEAGSRNCSVGGGVRFCSGNRDLLCTGDATCAAAGRGPARPTSTMLAHLVATSAESAWGRSRSGLRPDLSRARSRWRPGRFSGGMARRTRS